MDMKASTTGGKSHGHGGHYGKYRGTVTDNQDPNRQGRIKARVPEILGDVESGWALPCSPYAGKQSGAYTVPPKDAGVWIEFEAGDVSRPVWVGCWWKSGELPARRGGGNVTPEHRVLCSEEGLMLALHDDDRTVSVSDRDGNNMVYLEVSQGKVTIKGAARIVVEAPNIELVADAEHPCVFGDQLSSYLGQLVTIFNTHTHPGQTLAGAPVSPAPPVPPAQPLPPSALSARVRLG
jgi:hypothetical protein